MVEWSPVKAEEVCSLSRWRAAGAMLQSIGTGQGRLDHAIMQEQIVGEIE
jgi:hypothetical protein